MRYSDFEEIVSAPRMERYLKAMNFDKRKAMTLYRHNLKLSRYVFTLVSCFEVALRNAIDQHYSAQLGRHWMRDATRPEGMFLNERCIESKKLITKGLRKLGRNYSPDKLIAEMDFGFWRYLFAQPQYFAGGQSLLSIFPEKPRSTAEIQYNQRYIFQELRKINDFRNRVAHHEQICFPKDRDEVDLSYCRAINAIIIKLLQWMGISTQHFLFGLNQTPKICTRIEVWNANQY